MSLDTMSHGQSVGSQAAERYLLGELTESEREAFEGHYFDCPVCFEQVKLGSQFMHHAREVLDPEPEKGWLAGMLGDMRRPVPAFVSALFLCAIGTGVYQHAVIADLEAPRIEARYIQLTGPKKGASGELVSVSRKTGLRLRVEFIRKAEFTSYQAQIVTESGKVRVSLPVPAPVTDDSVTIILPAGALDAGKHSLVVYGITQNGTKTKAGKGDFDLEFQN